MNQLNSSQPNLISFQTDNKLPKHSIYKDLNLLPTWQKYG